MDEEKMETEEVQEEAAVIDEAPAEAEAPVCTADDAAETKAAASEGREETPSAVHAEPEEPDTEAVRTEEEPADTEEAEASGKEEKPADNVESKEEMELRDKATLEGLLYIVGDEGLSIEQACSALERKPEECEALLQKLKEEYDDKSHGIQLACFGGTWRFLSKESVHESARKLFAMEANAKLSQAALETLAIIAYKQPVTRVEIEEIRGVGADMMLRKLMARNLIRENGRSDAPGKPILYEVTEEFMNDFKLMSLKELPDLPTFHDDDKESEDLFKQ